MKNCSCQVVFTNIQRSRFCPIHGDKALKKQELMDGYDVIPNAEFVFTNGQRKCYNVHRVYRYEKPNVGKPIKVYKYGYPDYKSMLKKHPELK